MIIDRLYHHNVRDDSSHNTAETVDVARDSIKYPEARVVLPWLPYKGLFPEMFPFPHPTNLLLKPIHVLRHQDLRGKHS